METGSCLDCVYDPVTKLKRIKGEVLQCLLAGWRYRDTRGPSAVGCPARRTMLENCFCLLLVRAWARGMRPENSGTGSSASCRSWDYGIRGVSSDRLKDICVSQSPRQNIDLVGMKAGPRDTEGLRHSRVVGGSWWAEE